jgi:hypothetical protein
MLDSERIYVAIYAHSGKWRVKKLPKEVVEIGLAERKRHKSGERCLGCEMQTLDVEWSPETGLIIL